MERACQADNQAREAGQPALHKLKLLPEVTAILNRNNVQHAVLDPDTNFLQHVKFFLEPLNDGSLPAYNIQRDIFMALTRLNVEKETLLSSGIGKVVFFYTRSKKPEPSIKRMAQRLLGEWSRPILKRTDDYKKRHIETREFDYQYVSPGERFTTWLANTFIQGRQVGTTPEDELAVQPYPAPSSFSTGCRAGAVPGTGPNQQPGSYGQPAIELHYCAEEHLRWTTGRHGPSPSWRGWHGGFPQDDPKEQEEELRTGLWWIRRRVSESPSPKECSMYAIGSDIRGLVLAGARLLAFGAYRESFCYIVQRRLIKRNHATFWRQNLR